ncbi:4-diphosphocytidyl-2-C-methyl-D-erythritol kinase [Desulfuromonas soudanensis]|uniref:4-diphosphocytidyl-2-C-methyl-D-erythritol kinase n=1 Tax=Desulfuromonas soudanensis TaxID=1603606 RepID=A0A0M4DAZ4_9BACT|nr:4-(cytidine 5'-diphospho)-2-C-methyl-D-erythritol kinase [Desulfuromonas soudanensis]ALC17430.1 4-diphosphocytidyl-2-C-methyl-D-erythritol kinase [Desulfuromonas soudanensis]
MNKTFLAPAKINLCLHVVGKRPDGYHELAMLMQRVSLYDTVRIALVAEGGVRVVCKGVDLPPGGENIAARAARRMLELSGADCGVEIVIDKAIPVAAGLGGGSSDAAAVLMGLDEMLSTALGKERLMAEGGKLGADVPFFIFKEPAWATGIGDCLETVPSLAPFWYVLVNPGVAVSTAWVYQNLGLTSPGTVARMPGFLETTAGVVRLLHNDLEGVTIPRYPVIASLKERLLGLGAAGALMSGSGPTVFGVFEGVEAARAACEELATVPGWRSFLVRAL